MSPPGIGMVLAASCVRCHGDWNFGGGDGSVDPLIMDQSEVLQLPVGAAKVSDIAADEAYPYPKVLDSSKLPQYDGQQDFLQGNCGP